MPVAAVPQPVDFAVVFEDDELVVVDKPAGLVVHPGAGNPDGTLAPRVDAPARHRRGFR